MQDATSCRNFREYTLRVASIARRSNARSAPDAARTQACQLKNQGVLVSAPAQQSSQPAFARSTWLGYRAAAAMSTWVLGRIVLWRSFAKKARDYRHTFYNAAVMAGARLTSSPSSCEPVG
ncbi:hypothetical protein MTO96_013919 [Rhipicephalus appendiculatus]